MGETDLPYTESSHRRLEVCLPGEGERDRVDPFRP